MYCKKCGFITRGIEEKCPYCGTRFDKKKPLDQKFYMFNWFEISPRSIIYIIAFNLFALLAILDIVLVFAAPRVNYHISPYAFLAIFGLMFLFNEVIYPSSNKNRMLFVKGVLIFAGFSILMMVSYPSWIEDKEFLIFGKSSFLLSFGYFYPAVIIFLFIAGFIRFLVMKNFNVFSTFFYISFLVIMDLLLFIFSFFPVFGFDNGAKLCVYISFAVTMLFTINALVFSIFKMRTRFNIKS